MPWKFCHLNRMVEFLPGTGNLFAILFPGKFNRFTKFCPSKHRLPFVPCWMIDPFDLVNESYTNLIKQQQWFQLDLKLLNLKGIQLFIDHDKKFNFKTINKTLSSWINCRCSQFKPRVLLDLSNNIICSLLTPLTLFPDSKSIRVHINWKPACVAPWGAEIDISVCIAWKFIFAASRSRL